MKTVFRAFQAIATAAIAMFVVRTCAAQEAPSGQINAAGNGAVAAQDEVREIRSVLRCLPDGVESVVVARRMLNGKFTRSVKGSGRQVYLAREINGRSVGVVVDQATGKEIPPDPGAFGVAAIRYCAMLGPEGLSSDSIKWGVMAGKRFGQATEILSAAPYEGCHILGVAAEAADRAMNRIASGQVELLQIGRQRAFVIRSERSSSDDRKSVYVMRLNERCLAVATDEAFLRELVEHRDHPNAGTATPEENPLLRGLDLDAAVTAVRLFGEDRSNSDHACLRLADPGATMVSLSYRLDSPQTAVLRLRTTSDSPEKRLNDFFFQRFRKRFVIRTQLHGDWGIRIPVMEQESEATEAALIVLSVIGYTVYP